MCALLLVITPSIPTTVLNLLALGDLDEILDKQFKPILLVYALGISSKIALSWMSQDLTDDQSTFIREVDAVRQQNITRANFDPNIWQDMASLGQNELIG